MSENALAEQFESNRPQLRAVAYRLLGTLDEADDAVQEAWLRLRRADTKAISNLAAWLTTVVGRISLDMLRSRTTRKEQPLDVALSAPAAGDDDPGHRAELAESVSRALLVVLDTLTPAERLAFVLHDMFGVAFDEIAAVIDRTPDAARQLASRARRRVRTGNPAPAVASPARQRAVVTAFLEAARGGDLGTLVTLLDPDAELLADPAATRLTHAAAQPARGAEAVAGYFSGKAQAAVFALLDGVPGALVAPRGKLLLALRFTFTADRIATVEAVADPAALAAFALADEAH